MGDAPTRGEHISPSSWLDFGIKTCALTSHHLAKWPLGFTVVRSCLQGAMLAHTGTDGFDHSAHSECWPQGSCSPEAAGFASCLFTLKCFEEILRRRQNCRGAWNSCSQ